MRFDQIVESISFEEFKAIFLKGKLDYSQKMIDADKENLKFEDRRKLAELEQNAIYKNLRDIPFETKNKIEKNSQDTLMNIAYFARAISRMHPGWDKEGFQQDREEFKEEVEKLYVQQSKLPKSNRLQGNALLTEFRRITSTTLSDNHLTIQTATGDRPYKDKEATEKSWKKQIKTPYIKGSVGENSAFDNNRDILEKEGWLISVEKVKKRQNEYPLMIAEKISRISGETTAIVALSRSFLEEECPETLRKFREQLQNWDNVIIDVRGNGGWNSPLITAISEKLYGNQVPYCLQERRPQTPEAHLRDFQFKPTSKPQPKWDKKQHPFQGKQRKVCVLIDKETASSAEAIVPMLKNYPGIQFIGENTCGCCQYGAFMPVKLPCGGWMNIGTVYREYEDGMIECKGHKPDILCSGKNALQVALEKIDPTLQSMHTRLAITSQNGNHTQNHGISSSTKQVATNTFKNRLGHSF